MATIVFYAKPKCATNARQRQLLEAAGHQVLVRDLLTESWTADRLREFFADLPVSQWFNPAAPRIRDGLLDPQQLSPDQALALLVAEPLLIRRPLIEIDAMRIVGFDPQRLQGTVLPTAAGAASLQGCSRNRDQANPP